MKQRGKVNSIIKQRGKVNSIIKQRGKCKKKKACTAEEKQVVIVIQYVELATCSTC